MTLTINGKTFKVIEHINIKNHDGTPSNITLPLIDLTQLSDEEWQTLCQSRKERVAV